ncbi:heterocyst development glycosyltransferase HepC [Halotia branconii]|uniref:Sugar transferase n=1 Tax=Halotia branconii CENA392 TaxID=1539056 RepID=A0AAJ6NX58_9CYAN|nr:heterocyst development glycosyltransferase HepC [Halotia branconii]WGV28235.1 sugar transferase [Halotia branconii CENA392]
MTVSIIRTIQNYKAPQQPQDHRSPYCILQWRRGQLLVKSTTQANQLYLPSVDNEQLLIECLKHSPITLVSINPKLGETWLRFWAEACEQAHKPIFLRIPSGKKLPKQSSKSLMWLQRLIDGILASVLLLLTSPIILGLMILMRMKSPRSIFSREWHVGERGRLFRAIKFDTTAKHKGAILGRWMRKYGLDNLPQLFNVLRGEMSLLNSHCWTLEDAIYLGLVGQKQLNKLPVITSSWDVQTDSNLLHLDSPTL